MTAVQWFFGPNADLAGVLVGAAVSLAVALPFARVWVALLIRHAEGLPHMSAPRLDAPRSRKLPRPGVDRR